MVVSMTTAMALGTIGAAIAVAGGAIGTAMSQAAIGSAGLGLVAERPDQSGMVLVYLVIPETIVILGFVVAVLILVGAGII
jgi:V/A-type H+-transporting ATPase subunit K